MCQPFSTGEHSLNVPYIYQDAGESSRLEEQSQFLQASTMALLHRAGLKPGYVVLDLGCGNGDVTFAMLDILAGSGFVMGVDGNPQRVSLNQQQILPAQKPNIRFQVGQAETYTNTQQYDLTYSRFLFAHLQQPQKALQCMLAVTKPQGKVVLEDVDVSMVTSIPQNPALETLKQWLSQLVTLQGGDPAMGPKLADLMQAAGLTHIEKFQHHPSGKVGPIKRMPKLVLEGISPALIQAKLATEAEIQQILIALDQLANDPEVTVFASKVYQVIGQKI